MPLPETPHPEARRAAEPRRTQSGGTAEKSDLYRDLARQLAALIAGEPDRVANAANMAALLYHGLPDLNWAGFYFTQGEELVLGPFQGQPACLRIAVGKGVCGAAVKRGESVLVDDVRAFPGHIACGDAALSELVVPLIEAGECLGVLDLDSPSVGRFDEEDKEGLEALVGLFLAHQRAFASGAAPTPIRRRGAAH